MIVDWTRDEEAKYQASLVAKEVDNFAESSLESLKKEKSSFLIQTARSGSRSRSSSKGSKTSRSPVKQKKEKGIFSKLVF